MSGLSSSRWLKRSTFVAFATLVMTMTIVLMSTQQKSIAEGTRESLGIPLPFGGATVDTSSLKGAVSFYGQRNGIDVYEATFTSGEVSESLMPDRIYLVHVPHDATIVNAPLDNVLTSLSISSHNVNYYGYKYSDAYATMERRDINALRFKDRFSGQFFASKKARDDDPNHGNMLLAFERETETTFLKTDASVGAPRLDNGGSLFIFIVNEPGGALFSPRDYGTCGNDVVEGEEECDDGNTNNADMCKNDCRHGVPLPFGTGSSTMTGAKLAITQQTMIASDSAIATETGINLLTFQASAFDEDLRFTKLLFSAATGSLASLRNVTLWKDTNNDNVVDTLVQTLSGAELGTLSFSGSEVIAKYQTITYEVHADIVVAPAFFRLRIASLEADYAAGIRTVLALPLSGIRTNGVCSVSVCQIVVSTLPATLWTFIPPDPTRLTIDLLEVSATGALVEGETGAVLQALARGVDEDIDVRTLVFKAMTGSVEDMNFSLWADVGENDAFVQLAASPVIDTEDRSVKFHDDTTLFLADSADGVSFELRAMPRASVIRNFKTAFSVQTENYVEAWTHDSDPLQQLIGIKTNTFCAGVVCEILVREKPTTLFSILTSAPMCGNAVVEGAEECDNGADNGQVCSPLSGGTCTYCTAGCTEETLHGSAACGNGVQEGAEACDDGNDSNNDACTNACTVAVCGDGFIQTDEQCDDSNSIETDACTNLCTYPSTQGACLLSGLNAYWKFDEESGARLAATGSLDLSEVYGTTPSVSGNILSAISVSGSSTATFLLQHAGEALTNADRNFTVAQWLKLPIGRDGAALTMYASDNSHGFWNIGYRTYGSNPGYFFGIGDANIVSDTHGVPVIGEWALVVGSYNATAKEMSVSVNAGHRDTSTFTSSYPLHGDGSSEYLLTVQGLQDDQIDETGIWNRVLSQDEISRLYNAGNGLPFADFGTCDAPPVCRNGVREGAEQCDDGNTDNEDECDNSCQLTTPTPGM